MSKKRATRLKEISRDSAFRHAIKRTSVIHLFRDFRSTAALLDNFYTILIAHLPNLQNLNLHLRVEFSHGFYRQVARTQSLDQLSLKLFTVLEKCSVFSIGADHLSGPFTCPRFVTSLLRIPSLRRFSTDYFIPDKLPPTSITTLDMKRADCRAYIVNPKLSWNFFHDADKLETLMLDVSSLRDFYHTRPTRPMHLVVYESNPRPRCFQLTDEPFLEKLKSLHLHRNIILNAGSGPNNDSYPKHPDSWIKLLRDSVRTLCIFGMEEEFLSPTYIPGTNAATFRTQLSKISGAYSR